MARLSIFALVFLLCAGCNHTVAHMQNPEDPQGRYREQIAVARHLLEQKEDWAAGAEWEVLETPDGWQCIAWRVVHPEGKGAGRYLPWGCSIIDVNRRLEAIKYERKG